MRVRPLRILFAVVLVLSGLVWAGRSYAQYRDYNISGVVVDTNKQPVAGVLIDLRDVVTSRSYSLKTKKDGTFKFVGLPHGIYSVVFKKEGFAEKTDEWKFETPQETMKRVEMPPVVLASQEVVNEAQRMRQAAAGVKAAGEKLRTGDYDGALADLKTILEKDPKDSNALYLTGMAYIKKKMWSEAIPPMTEVTALSPKFAAAYYQLGICNQNLGEQAKALEFYNKAMALDAANPDAPYNAGLILFAASKVDEALALFEKSLALRPDDPMALEMAGRCYINKTEFAKAVEYLEKAKALYSNNPDQVKFLEGLIAQLKEQIKK